MGDLISLTAVFLLVVSVIGNIYRKRFFLLSLPLLLMSFLYGIFHIRLIALFFMTFVVFECESFLDGLHCLARGVKEYSASIVRSFALVVVGFICAGIVKLLIFISTLSHFSLEYTPYPVQAVEWFDKNSPGGKILVDFNSGSYVLWRLFPRFLVSLDGRYEEVYTESTFLKVTDAFNPISKTQAQSVEELAPEYILVGSDWSAYRSREGFGPMWKTVYNDEKFAILSKK